jgi:Na+/melibiose symporter-like transporter
MTRLHGLWSLGTLIGSGLSALAVLAGVGLGLHLAILAIVGTSAVLFAARLVPESQNRARSGMRSGRLALGLMLAGGTAVFIEGAPLDWSAIFMIDVISASAALASTGVIVFTTGMLAGRLAGDHLVDRFGPVRVLYTGLVASVTSMIAVVTTRSSLVALPAFALWGLGISVALPVLYKLAGSHPSFGEGSGLAALTVGTRLGFMVAPALIGVAAIAWGLPTALAVIVGAAALATTLSIRLALGTAAHPLDSIPDSEGS